MCVLAGAYTNRDMCRHVAKHPVWRVGGLLLAIGYELLLVCIVRVIIDAEVYSNAHAHTQIGTEPGVFRNEGLICSGH